MVEKGLTLKDVLHRVVFDQPDITPAQLADQVGVSYSMLTNAANPDQQGFKFAARHLIPITKLTGDYRLLDFLEQSCGRVAFSLPDLPDNIADVPKLVADSVKEFGDVLQEVSKAIEDGKIDQVELKRLEKEILEHVQVEMALLEAARRVAK